MVNCNPETVSTDYDTSDKLYFEPITKEHVQSVIRSEDPRGIILQLVAKPVKTLLVGPSSGHLLMPSICVKTENGLMI